MTSKIILITGANRGIGLESARQLARLGHRVLLGSRDAGRGKAALAKLQAAGLSAQWVSVDVESEKSIRELAGEIEKQYGRLDVLINNAGILQDQAGTLTVSRAELQKHLEVNFFGPLLLSQALMPLLRKSPAGRIINFSTSMATLQDPGAGSAAYRLSKVALNGLTAIMSADLAGTPITVNCLDPGWVKTDMGGPGANREVETGAATAVWLATAEKVPSGKFFRDKQEIAW